MTQKSLNLRLSLYYATLFLVMGIYIPFWPLWLKEQGLDDKTIGLLMAIAPWLQIITAPGFALVADATGHHKKTLISLALFAGVCFYAIAQVGDGLLLLFILQAAAVCSYYSMIPIGDSQILQIVNKHHLSYGRLRMWGSISFIASSVVGGKVLDILPSDMTVWMIIIALIFCALALGLLPDNRKNGEKDTGAKENILQAFLQRPWFLVIIFATSCITASHAAFYAFGSLYMRSLGYDDSVIGLIWAGSVCAEILLLYHGKKMIARFTSRQLILLGGCGAAIRWFALTEIDDVWVFGLSQCLHMFSFAATHLGISRYLSHHAPTGLAASSQSLYSGLANGLMMGIGVLIAGFLFPLNPQWAFWFSGILATGGVLLALIQRQPQEAV